MKISKYLSMAALGILAFGFNSCENGNQEFPDYEGAGMMSALKMTADRMALSGL